MSTALIVFAKAPRPGLAKTRLIPALGADGAAALAARLLERTLDAALAAGVDAVELCTTPDGSDPARHPWAHRSGLALTWQGDGDLGQRMHAAFVRALKGHDAALLIGTDAPALDAAMLRAAAAALARHDAVLVPAVDGGYALVGLRRADARLFGGIAWSTPTVMAATRQRLRELGLRWAELPPVADIDVPADLVHLPAGWSA